MSLAEASLLRRWCSLCVDLDGCSLHAAVRIEQAVPIVSSTGSAESHAYPSPTNG